MHYDAADLFLERWQTFYYNTSISVQFLSFQYTQTGWLDYELKHIHPNYITVDMFLISTFTIVDIL